MEADFAGNIADIPKPLDHRHLWTMRNALPAATIVATQF
jgi:hypothetical protein